ncbi:acyl-CoA N-acyltransferase [Hysterangium stoloniferum]|nr:acyl-CoA N-acyltransferase [Hysterangium stoloniferum]
MIVNEKTAIVGRNIVLVPYRPEHVERYHQWMLSPELRELTASEPLTLEEEYQMQQNWQKDEDKLTFIILARPHLLSNNIPVSDETPTQEEISAYPMVGDVNLFFKNDPEGYDEVEAEVMIAGSTYSEPSYRRKDVAHSALNLIFDYATSPDGPPPLRIPPNKLVVRIGEDNTSSIRLFEKLSFVVTRRVAVFQEVELRYRGDGKWIHGKCVTFD